MKIQINTNDQQLSPAIDAHVRAGIDKALKVFASRVTRVEVHLHDDNGPKSGSGKRCLIEVRLAGMQPMAVEDEGDDLYHVITEAAGKLERAVRHKVERRQD